MITVRRDHERRHVRRGKRDIWSTFYPQDRPSPLAEDFGVLAAFDEKRLPPGGVGTPLPGDESEIVTYLFRGTIAHEDSTGSSGVVHAGEFRHMTAGRAIRHRETNASRTDWAHLFQISLHPPEAGLSSTHEQKRFAAAQRRNVLCVVASPDGRKGSFRIHQDALVCSSVLDPGHHLIHELLGGRSAWLHVVYGEATLNDLVLTRGDGAGLEIESAVSLTALESTEILLVDLCPATRPFGGGVVPRAGDR
jgi:redox-sensitive bicupin YhaK (pirin superfamily)